MNPYIRVKTKDLNASLDLTPKREWEREEQSAITRNWFRRRLIGNQTAQDTMYICSFAPPGQAMVRSWDGGCGIRLLISTALMKLGHLAPLGLG